MYFLDPRPMVFLSYSYNIRNLALNRKDPIDQGSSENPFRFLMYLGSPNLLS